MKKFANRSFSAFLERYFDKVDETQVSSLISDGKYEEKDISFKPSFLYSFKLPFTISSSKVDSFKIVSNSSPSIFTAEGVNLVAMYSDCKEFNPYAINPPSLSLFTNKILSEKIVKKVLFSFLLKDDKISFCIKNSTLHFEIPRCSKTNKDNTNKNKQSTLGSFGFLFDEISFSDSKTIKITNMSIYVFPQLEHMNIEKFEVFKSNLENNQSNSFILRNFNYEGQINDLQIDKEIELNFSFSQISFLKFFARKLYYLNCGCPNVYTKNSCIDWWAYSYRCFLKDKHCFNVMSAINFLKNRKTFNPKFERNQYIMYNTYKRSLFKLTNTYQEDINSVNFTSDEKDAFNDFYNQSKDTLIPSLNFKISFLSKLKIKVRNTLNGFLDLGQIQIQKDIDSISIETNHISLSYDFLPFLFLLIKDKLLFKKQNGIEFKMNTPLIKIIGNNDKNDPIGSIDINNLTISEKGFSIDSIKNFNETFLLTNISAQDTNENKKNDPNQPIPAKKNYIIKIDDTKLTTKFLFNLIFYKKSNHNYNNSRSNLNLHNFLHFFNQIEYVLSLSNVSLYINDNNIDDHFSFKMHFVNTFDSLVIGIDKITFGQIIKDFVVTATINHSYEGQSVFLDFSALKVSLFPAEIPLFVNILTEIKPFIYRYIKMIPQIKNFVFCSKGFNLLFESTEFSLAQFNISDFSFKSVCGFTQFSINNNQALFYDRKLNKWCVLMQPFNIAANIQGTCIEISLSLQFNFTRIFFNDIIKFLTSKDKRIELPRKIKIKNLTSYPLIIQEIKDKANTKADTEQSNTKEDTEQSHTKIDTEQSNTKADTEQSHTKIDTEQSNTKIYTNLNTEQENKSLNEDDDLNKQASSSDDDDIMSDDGYSAKTRLDVNAAAFLKSRKFRIEVENANKKLSESYTIDSNHLQFPLYISNQIVLSKGESSICFCSPFVIVNKTTFKNLCVHQIRKKADSEANDYDITLVGHLETKGSKLGIYHPNVLITGENDNATQIFVSHLNDTKEEENEYQMMSAIASTFDKKPQLLDIVFNGNKETILVSSQFNYEKGALFINLMNPFVIVNQVPECKSVSLSLSTPVNTNEKKKRLKHKNEVESDSPHLTAEISELPPYQKAHIPIQMIPSCSVLFQNQPTAKANNKNKNVHNSFDLMVKLNDFLGIQGKSIQSQLAHIVVSEDFQFFPIQFSESQFTFSITLKIQHNPRKGNYSLILFAPSVIENRTNLAVSINSLGNEKVSTFCEQSNKIIFGCDSFFTESRNMPVFVGYNREFKLSDRPIELCFKPFSAPLMLPSLIHKDCFLPLFYRTSMRGNRQNGSFTIIDYYKIIENKTPFDFTLTPIKELRGSNTYATFQTKESSDKRSKRRSKQNEEEDENDDRNNPQILFKQNETKPILLATSSFCYKFEIKDTAVPICLLKDNYRTCFRVEKEYFVLLTITEKKATFELSDFSSEKVFMTFTNFLPTESIFINSSASQPPICIEPNSTSLFGYDSPFESTTVSIFAMNDQVEFRCDRCYEPLSSPMNKFVVQCISKQLFEEIEHSIVVRLVDSGYEDDQNQQRQSLPNMMLINSPNGENLNINSKLKGATTISIEKESNQNLLNDDSNDRKDFENETEDDPLVNSRIMNQTNDRLSASYDIDDYECFAGYSVTVNVPIFEISLIDDRLSELALICLYQSSFVVNNDRSMMARTIQFSIKTLQVFDMNVMTLFPTVISSNPDNANFLTIDISYFDKMTVDQLKVTISPLLISPDINFLNEIFYFFRKIENTSEITNKVFSNDLLCRSKIFNFIQVDPIVIVINIKASSARNLNTPKLVTFNKNLTTSFALNGYVIHNAEIAPSFFISITNHLLQMKLNYSKIFHITSPNDILAKHAKGSGRMKADPNPTEIVTLLSIDETENRIINSKVYRHLFNFPALHFESVIEKNLKDKPAKILEALSQTESYFKLASDKMRLISNDKIDRDEYLIPQRKGRFQTLPQTREETSSKGSEPGIQGSVKKEKTANAAQTVANGFSSAAKSFRSGFTGIIRKPIEGGKENGAKGAFKGIGQGLLGVLTCTVSSVIEVGSGIAGGIRKSIMKDNTSNYMQCRPPSTFLLRCISTNSANNSDEGENSFIRNIEDVKNFFDSDLIENAELAQQVINNGQYLALPKEKEERLVFFSEVKQNAKRISYLGITTDSIFVFNASLSVLNKFDLEYITWFKKKIETLSNNDESFNNDNNANRKIVFDVYNPSNMKEIRYELELTSENAADLAVQFFSSKLRAYDIIREEQDEDK
ncbi:hypothetical protein M9Y10_005499 [Tritrichomonas musculus]|uniref:Uncharacterized protein n=1 Tax=Tritrichomonas musculus TaxID=1915356 RepID=A0ABR2JC78_9EUKA